VANQLFAAYSRAVELRGLAAIVGEESLSEVDRKYLRFGEAFEQKFLKQDYYERRTIEQTLDLAWEVLSILPEEELTKIRPEYIKKYHPKYRVKAASQK